MVVPQKRPKMIIFSRKTPWLLGTSILGNPHMDVVKIQNNPFVWKMNRLLTIVNKGFGTPQGMSFPVSTGAYLDI